MLNIAYNFWFIVLIATIFTACITRKDTRLRHQFLMSFMLAWILGGFFLAMGLSSAGPCYYERLGFGSDFHPLMQALAAADRVYPIWALRTQNLLWSGYIGETSGSIGISAFPSLHVAMAVLFALYATRRSAGRYSDVDIRRRHHGRLGRPWLALCRWLCGSAAIAHDLEGVRILPDPLRATGCPA